MVELPSFGLNKIRLPLDKIFVSLALLDHKELLDKGSNVYEELLVAKKHATNEVNFSTRFTYYLVEGRPGSGKTTLVTKMAADWSLNNCGATSLDLFALVFVIRLREVQNIESFQKLPSSDLAEILYSRCLKLSKKNETESNNFFRFEETLQNYKEKVLIIIDGLDEYTYTIPALNCLIHPDEDEFTQEEPQWFSDATLMVTTRPTAEKIQDARKREGHHYEISGFDSSRMKIFVNKCMSAYSLKNSSSDTAEGSTSETPVQQRTSSFSSERLDDTNASDAKKLLSIIESDSDLKATCQTAYSLGMVCLLFSTDKNIFGESGSSTINLPLLYHKVIMCITTNNMLQRGLFGGKKEETELTPKQEEKLMTTLTKIGSLALEGINAVSDAGGVQLDFAEEDVASFIGDDQDMRSVGLLTSFECVGNVDMFGRKKTIIRYTFPHLTIQEFMAAWGIVFGGNETESESGTIAGK